MTTLNRVLITFFILFLILCLGIGLYWFKFARTPFIYAKEGIQFYVPSGANYKTLSTALHQQKLISHPLLFSLLVRYQGNKHKLKAGEYLFPYGATPLDVLHQLTTGTGLIYHSIVIVPGTTFSQFRSALNNNTQLKHVSLGLSDVDLIKRLGISSPHPEGLFFPDTYYFALGTSDLVILETAYYAMQKKLNFAWQHRAVDLPYKTPYDILIAASIVEKETGLQSERPIIAGVIKNRLQQDMLLQFDPTVIYGLGSRYDGKIYLSNLREDTPYNTYLHKGLTPTPICLPSLASITAVTQPVHHAFLYFVAKPNGDGHQFSSTLIEHNSAVSSYRKHHYDYFNADLIHRYLKKILGQKIFNIT